MPRMLRWFLPCTIVLSVLGVCFLHFKQQIQFLNGSVEFHRTKFEKTEIKYNKLRVEYDAIRAEFDEVKKNLYDTVQARELLSKDLNKCQGATPFKDEGPVTLNSTLEEIRENEISWTLVDSKGKERWTWDVCAKFDCVRNEALCPSQAPTNLQGKGAPCCNHLLRDLMLDVGDFLNQHRFEWFIHYGTLLGAQRNGQIIPWTSDVDIGLNMSDWQIMVNNKTLKREMWDKGYNYFAEPFDTKKPNEGSMGRLCFGNHYKNGILKKWPKKQKQTFYYDSFAGYMDIYVTVPVNSTTVGTPKGPCKFQQEWVYPLKNMTLWNATFPIPFDSNLVLSHLYGPKWEKQIKKTSHGVHMCKG